MSEITRILSQIDSGDPSAAEKLLPLVYDELRQLAAAKMAHEQPGQTLQATALVHEAYLRLVQGKPDQQWNSRGHFFGAAAEAMRRILVDNYRTKRAQRHGGHLIRVPLSEIGLTAQRPTIDMLALDEAICRLEQEQPQVASVVKLRYFAGLTIDETATALGLSPATVERYWSYARARLHAEMWSEE